MGRTGNTGSTGDGDNPLAVDPVFERRHKMFQRVGWAFLLLFLAAALAGLLGGGGLSTRTKSSGNYALTYDRVLQRQAPAELRIDVRAHPQAGVLQVILNAGYLDRVSIERITPEPKATELAAGGVMWSFPAEAGPASSFIYFEIQPKRPGSVAAELQVGKQTFVFKQLVLP